MTGFTTANNGHWIIEGKAGIVIAEAVLVERGGKIYSIDVQPDEVIWAEIILMITFRIKKYWLHYSGLKKLNFLSRMI